MNGTRKPIILEAEGRTSTLEAVSRGLPERIRTLTEDRRGIILMDRALEAEAKAWAEAARPDFSVIFPEGRGEAVKAWDEARRLLEIMIREKLGRDDWLVVRGGGALTDLGGFAAGLYRRGLKLILVPTTLLGAVDAAVGGKTAVNLGEAKNQVGHFYLADHVLVDLAAFRSLTREQLADGLVEAYKMGLLLNPGLAEQVATQSEDLLAGDPELLADVVQRSMRAKAGLVGQDFREERGLRELLNLGHTYGHVVESFYMAAANSGQEAVPESAPAPTAPQADQKAGTESATPATPRADQKAGAENAPAPPTPNTKPEADPKGVPMPEVSHGRAVALGLAVIARLSRARGLLAGNDAERIVEVAGHLAGSWPEPPPESAVLELLRADKKIRADRLRLVLLERAGHPKLVEADPEELLRAARKFIKGGRAASTARS